MICPVCGKKFTSSKEFVIHLLEKEMFTKDEIYDRMIILGMLTKEEIDEACM